VTIEEVSRWFDVPERTSLPYMIVTVDVRPEYRAQLPPSRTSMVGALQTVSASDNAAFHALLVAVGR